MADAGYVVLIPARLGSSRLPDKPLADLAGLPMVVRVAQQASKSSAQRIVVAADHPSIVSACHSHGIEAVLTRNDHPSGSDRLAETAELLGLGDDEIVVNVQGDEPLIHPQHIHDVAQLLAKRENVSMSTLAHPITNLSDWLSPHVVKVVMDEQSMAAYFSRASIPCWRDAITGQLPPYPVFRHVGLYAYKTGFLKKFPHLSQAPTEQAEALEQLRALWHGHKIAVHVSQQASAPGVDTPDDLARVQALFRP
ncbi:MAG: 3-deoxy-manno-octulosonate cytidylyltransferase [Betaproteobacteria bacterium]|nr:3-deoxy-manno-octulosonate cytidylyltransferase [Betaproteobacteria bacterium]